MLLCVCVCIVLTSLHSLICWCYFLQRFRDIYETQLKRGPPSFKAQYDYAWCLVRSASKADMQHGIVMLEGQNSNFSSTDPG